MASIPDEKVQEVRDRVDIVDLVGRYVELRRSGQNYKGLCPFHSERSPSFNVNPARKGFKCFGCGQSGDAIRFVMDLEGKSFPEALRKLAEMYGVSLPNAGPRGSADDRNERDEAYGMMRRAAELYREILLTQPEGAAGREYVTARGLDDEVSESFGLGYAPAPSEAGWDRLTQTLRSEGHAPELAIKLGLSAQSERKRSAYDRFRGRLMFPVQQPGGEIVGFSGRIVPPHDEDGDNPPPKYVNSADTILTRKGKQLFGLAQARRSLSANRRAILVEGNIDVVKMHQWGLPETVAPMGTSLTDDQAKLLARFTDQVVMCFDGDQAGKKAAWTAVPILLRHDLDVRMVLLPNGEDPDSLGRERLLALVERARPALVELMIRIAAKAGNAVDARAQGLDRIVPLIAQVPRQSARDLYADRAAELFDVPRPRVAASLQAAARAHAASARAERGPSPSRSERGGSPPRSEHGSRDSDGPPYGAPPPGGPDRFRAESDRSMPVSGAVQPSPQLPGGQAQLTMLLVDVPHLAAAARREGAIEHVTDPRLRPIVDAVLAGAQTGHDPTLDELLSLVDESEQRRVHDTVFVGSYRTDTTEDPALVLHELVHRCREEAIEHRIAQVDREFSAALESGDRARATELQQTRLTLRREQQQLRQGPSVSPAAAAPTATAPPEANEGPVLS
jgi:DNA primase